MRNNSCTVCAKEFEPRAGKQYCSNACKQKAFSDRKHLSEINIEREKNAANINYQFELNFKEYQEYQSLYGDYIENFQLYCFFRKNLVGNPSLEDINDYINSFSESWWMDFHHDERSPARKVYREFEAKFFGDEYRIRFAIKTNENNSEK